MRLSQELREFDAAGAEVECTIVHFTDDEAEDRQRFIERLPYTTIPFDREIFPEEIVIARRCEEATINSIIHSDFLDHLIFIEGLFTGREAQRDEQIVTPKDKYL